jgi:hypothetical protein
MRPLVQVVLQVPAWHDSQAPQPIWPLVQQVSFETQLDPHSFNPLKHTPLHGWSLGMQALPHLWPERQSKSHTLFLQTGEPLAGAVQALPHIPQF